MNHSPAQIVVQLMINKSLGTLYSTGKDWPIYYGSMPTEPDNVLTVYDTFPKMDGRIQATGEVVTHPGVMIRIRNTKYNPGWKKGDDIALAFDNIRNENVVLEGRTYRIASISRSAGVIPLGQEQGKTRMVFTLNCTITVSDITP